MNKFLRRSAQHWVLNKAQNYGRPMTDNDALTTAINNLATSVDKLADTLKTDLGKSMQEALQETFAIALDESYGIVPAIRDVAASAVAPRRPATLEEQSRWMR